MRIPGKKFALVAAPLLMAGAMLGVPLAGSAHAADRRGSCETLSQAAANYYDEAATDFYYANRAEEAGAWTDYVYYSYLEAKTMTWATT